jgi:hypothetical protein
LRNTSIGFSTASYSTVSISQNFLPHHDIDKFREEEKEVTAIFCKYRGCLICKILYYAKNCCIKSAEWVGALS